MIDKLIPVNQPAANQLNVLGGAAGNQVKQETTVRKVNNEDGSQRASAEIKMPLDQEKEDKIAEAMEKANETVRIFNPALHFTIHKETGRVMVQVIDTVNNKVIREVPPEKILDMIAKIQEMVGLLLDEIG